GFPPGKITGFREFVAEKYNAKGQSQCFERPTEAAARDFMQTTSPGAKKVFTGWQFNGAPTPSVQAASPTIPPASPAPSSGALQGFCSLNWPGSPDYEKGQPAYFSAMFAMTIGNPGALFAQYVMKKYAVSHFGGPSCTNSSVGVSQLEPLLREQKAKAQALGA